MPPDERGRGIPRGLPPGAGRRDDGGEERHWERQSGDWRSRDVGAPTFIRERPVEVT
jgi:hypothetical protein